MVWTLPSEVSKSLPGFVKGFTRAMGKLADGFLNRGGFPYGVIFSMKFFLHFGPTSELFSNFKNQSLAQSLGSEKDFHLHYIGRDIMNLIDFIYLAKLIYVFIRVLGRFTMEDMKHTHYE